MFKLSTSEVLERFLGHDPNSKRSTLESARVYRENKNTSAININVQRTTILAFFLTILTSETR